MMKKRFFATVLLILCLLFAVGCEAKKAENTADREVLHILSDGLPEEECTEYAIPTVFICFSDDSVSAMRASIAQINLSECLNGENGSLRDYYSQLSYGTFSVRSYFPNNTGEYFIYQDNHPRSYYLNNDHKSGSGRWRVECALLNNALAAASSYFSFGGLCLDQNGDGYVDTVNFLIGGTYDRSDSSLWGKIMWPHSSALDSNTASVVTNGHSSSLGGLLVENYTFFYLEELTTVGLLCHETCHSLLNANDLYHYKYNLTDYPVGYWDLMHLECEIPQFLTTYSRDKLLGCIGKNQIVELKKDGEYTLTPTVTTGRDGVLAYTVSLNEKEKLWIEYRRNDVALYDSQLPSSGLILYRTNSTASNGNQNAKKNNSHYPEEIFVYRHDAAGSTLTGTDKEKYNLKYAALGTQNPYGSSYGSSVASTGYKEGCVFLSDGNNTGIVVTVLEDTAESVRFSVTLGDYNAGSVEYGYVYGTEKNVEEINYGESVDVELYLKYKTRSSVVTTDDFTLEYTYEVCEDGQTAYAVYTDEYGTHKYPFRLIIHEKTELTDASVIALPTTTDYRSGESFSLDGLILLGSYGSKTQQIAYSEDTKDLWSAVGYDMNKCGKQYVTVTYDGKVNVSFYITVRSNLVSIRVDERNSWHIVGNGKKLSLNVYGKYADGMELPLEESAYTLSYDENLYCTKVPVTVTAAENGAITCTSYLYRVDAPITSLVLLSFPQLKYTYGEGLNLASGRVQVSFSIGYTIGASEALPLENFFSAIEYQPTKIGSQVINIAVDNARLSFVLNVEERSESLLATSSSALSVLSEKKLVLLKEDTEIRTLETYLSSYLTIVFCYNDNPITAESYKTMLAGSCVTVRLYNDDGTVIETFSVARLGDGNGDGKITEEDRPYWTKELLNNATGVAAYDVNQDGSFTLTDFVLLLNMIREEE